MLWPDRMKGNLRECLLVGGLDKREEPRLVNGNGWNVRSGPSACWRYTFEALSSLACKTLIVPYSNPAPGEPPTGEPDAGDPLVRFGGRGGASQCTIPTPIVIIRKSTRFRVKPGMTARGYFTYDLLSNGQRARALLENRRLPILQKTTNLCIPCLKRAPPFRDGRVVKCKLFHALSSNISGGLEFH